MKLAAVLLALPLLAQQAVIDQKEKALGERIAKEIRAQSKPLGLPEVDQYVTDLGKRLAPDQDIRYEVLVDSAPEPMFLPGGILFVPASLLAAASNEAEFSGKLAHGIAHIALHHGVQKNTSGIPLVFLGGWNGSLVPKGFQEQQRAWEKEADSYAASLLERAPAAETAGRFEHIQQAVRAALPQKQQRKPTLGR